MFNIPYIKYVYNLCIMFKQTNNFKKWTKQVEILI